MEIWVVLADNTLIINLQVCSWEWGCFYNLFVGLTPGEGGVSKHALYLVFPRDIRWLQQQY